MKSDGRDEFRVWPEYQPIVREVGLDAERVFSDSRIVVWRSIVERENCTLDARLGDGREIRWHIKRYRAVRASKGAAEAEVAGIEMLKSAGIATVPLVGWGKLADGRGFVISEDLKGFAAADKLIGGGMPFDRLIEATADLAAKLHGEGLHHRDLYLCHFFVKTGDDLELRLIDAARVRKLPRFFRQRWVVKDLAQFWYSARQLGIVEDQLIRWLGHYTDKAGKIAPPLGAIEGKVEWIAEHDRKLNREQPKRNVSIPAARRA